MHLLPLESLLNRNIAQSPLARQLCRGLQGKVLALQLAGLPAGVPATVYFHSTGDGLGIATHPSSPPDASLTGTPLSMLRLAGTRDMSTLRASGIRIEGSADIAQAFSELLSTARPDFEEELSRVIGDVAAHQVGNAARALLDFGRRAAGTLAQNTAEYLQEEGRDVPARTEAEELHADIDRLRDDVERLEARLALLQDKRKA
jgi:ubiquinone biosynthesis accessory factor UbiJ